MTDTVPSATNAVLDARYGRTLGGRRRQRRVAIVAAVLFAAVFTAWVMWAGLNNGQGSLDSRDIGFRIVDDRTVSLSWEVSVNAGTEVSCALQAQNESHGIVGWRIVDLPASDSYTRQFTETLRTAQRAVTGLIYRCWLT